MSSPKHDASRNALGRIVNSIEENAIAILLGLMTLVTFVIPTDEPCVAGLTISGIPSRSMQRDRSSAERSTANSGGRRNTRPIDESPWCTAGSTPSRSRRYVSVEKPCADNERE